MSRLFGAVLLVGVFIVSGVFFYSHKKENSEVPIVSVSHTDASDTGTDTDEVDSPESSHVDGSDTEHAPATLEPKNTSSGDTTLLSLADKKYTSGDLPLGDGKYTTTGPKKGYIYVCRVTNGGGAQVDGSWIHGSTWNIFEKISVRGSVLWPNASFTETISGTIRKLVGNGLPLAHATGTFPVASNDPAYLIDRNPNRISSQNLSYSIPAHPTLASAPSCVGGEVGIMLSGVPLFNGFDAGMRDAAAHEVQDACQGHPQEQGEYHYHSLSSCFTDTSVHTVLGYALDGFPITGPLVAGGKYLTTEDLDECHGITSTIVKDGVETTAYHYVMTQDFPYSVSCFKGTPIKNTPSVGTGSANQTTSSQPNGGTPPAAAISACSGKNEENSCSFSVPDGTKSGICRQPPNSSSLACVPA